MVGTLHQPNQKRVDSSTLQQTLVNTVVVFAIFSDNSRFGLISKRRNAASHGLENIQLKILTRFSPPWQTSQSGTNCYDFPIKPCIMFGFRVGNQEPLCGMGLALGSKCHSPPPTQDWRYAQMHHSCQGGCWLMQNTDCWPGSKFQKNLFAFQINTLQNCQYISTEGSHFSGYNVKIFILVDVFGFSYN